MAAVFDGTVDYEHNGEIFEGYFVHAGGADRPVVIVAHAWGGLSDYEMQAVRRLADTGYAVFALDMYGKGKRGSSAEENAALMNPLVADRAELQARLVSAINIAKSRDGVDAGKIGAIGFCFGGLCVLDMARMGADLRGVVSFHGLFGAPDNLQGSTLKAKVLALHGWDDPMATPDDVLGFTKEMTSIGADWQLHAYGDTVHAFTNPAATDRSTGTFYDKNASRRAWAACDDFLAEVFGG